MREWILSVFAASLLSAAALALCPPGRVRSVTRMTCGLVCALALASPLVKLDMDRLAAGLAAYGQQAEKITENAEDEQKMLERTYIEEKAAAYISDKAAELGLERAAFAVLARWDDSAHVWYPWELTAPAAYDARLSGIVEAELGIPAARQHWNADG